MVQGRYFVAGVTLLAAGLILQHCSVCGQKTVNPGSAGTIICSVDATSPHTVFTASGGINCSTAVAHRSTLLAACQNSDGQLALVFNGTANDRSNTIQFVLRVVDLTITNTRITCLDGNEIFGEVQITGGQTAICSGDSRSVYICTVNATLPYTVFTAKGEINCSRTRTVRGSTSLLEACRNNADELALVFNGTADDQSNTVQFNLRVVDLTITNTHVICSDGNKMLGEVFIAGPPSVPDINVTFAKDHRQFDFQLRSTSDVGVDGYQLNVPDLTGLTCVDSNIDTNTRYSCSNWPDLAFGKKYTFSISASNCRYQTEQVGPTSEVTITLQVPDVATLTLTPVYDLATAHLLRIESQCNTLPSVTLATTSTGFTLEEDPSHYHFTYSSETIQTQTVKSVACTGGECKSVFAVPVGTTARYEVSVAVENAVGVGESSASQTISTTNNLLQVETDVRNQIVQCRFLRAFNGRAECQVEFSTQEDFSNSIVATGSSTSGDTIIVTLKATLEGRATYYYRVTATAEGVSVRVEDIIQTPPIQDSMKGSPDSDPPLWIIGVVMGTIILLIAAGVIIGIFIWRYKNQGQEKGNENPKSDEEQLQSGTWRRLLSLKRGARPCHTGQVQEDSKT